MRSHGWPGHELVAVFLPQPPECCGAGVHYRAGPVLFYKLCLSWFLTWKFWNFITCS